MASKISLTTAILILSALLPALAQAPDGGKKTQRNAAPALRFTIYGAVNRPGVYAFKPGYHLSDALSSASGPTERADLGIIMLTHAGRPQNTANMVWVSFNDFVLKGKMAGNPVLQPGDGLYVLGKGRRYKPSLPMIVN